MDDKRFYNEILLEHDRYPAFRHPLPDADIVLDGVNPSCGDEIRLLLKTDGDTIVDGAFVGEGCAVSQASCDIMRAYGAAVLPEGKAYTFWGRGVSQGHSAARWKTATKKLQAAGGRLSVIAFE